MKGTRYFPVLTLVTIILGCGGNSKSPSVDAFANWELEVSSPSSGVDATPITKERFLCSRGLNLGVNPDSSIKFRADFTREQTGERRTFSMVGFKLADLIVGASRSADRSIADRFALTITNYPNENPAANPTDQWFSYAGTLKVTSVEGNWVTFDLDVQLEDELNPGDPELHIAGTYSFDISMASEYTQFMPCPDPIID